MTAMIATIEFIALCAASFFLTRAVRRELLRRDLLDVPNHRSSHTVPVPRGGGLAVIAVLLPAWAVISLLFPVPGHALAIVAGAVAVAVLSLMDDLKGLGAGRRLLIQAVAVGAGLFALPEGSLTNGWLPLVVERILVFFAWLWFVNLYNFMDGIDGITGTQTIFLCLGLGVFAAVADQQGTVLLSVAVAASVAGFLVLNWHPAKIFLGDVGSVTLGYLLGWLLLSLAIGGDWAAALIIPAYYLADATITLASRALRGEKLAQAHREHFYQKAAKGIGSHAKVVGVIAVGNAAFLAIAVGLTQRPVSALILAAAALSATLAVLVWMARRA
ncbi:MAG: glycosyltransferase family 4 protein [Rhodospirillaceae bacterium]|nr:glycosyltransferase family 4 protein [Rhodospirillales bacterium]